MIATLWGVFVWHEFRGAAKKSKLYLGGMVAAYLAALALIAKAYQG
jgi:glucose uptake protein